MSNDSTKAIQKFNFQGDSLNVLRDGDRLQVVVRGICDGLGLGYSSQLQKLKDKEWATVTLIVTVAEDGKAREMAMIDLDSLPMWLATIEPSRVAPHVRPKLVAYQRDVARVLRDHFFGAKSQAPDSTALIGRLVDLVTSLEARLLAVESRPANSNHVAIGMGGARTHVLDPLKEIARIEARAIGKSDQPTLNRMRKLADDALRERVGFPRAGGQAWCKFPQARLGDLHCALARVLHAARRRADIAAPTVRQLTLASNLNGKRSAS